MSDYELYLKRFRDRATGILTHNIPDILEYLFINYGEVTDEEVIDMSDKLKSMVFDITQPIVVLYNEIQDLQDLADAAKNTFL